MKTTFSLPRKRITAFRAFSFLLLISLLSIPVSGAAAYHAGPPDALNTVVESESTFPGSEELDTSAAPGSLPAGYLNYDIQSGDTLPSLAARFNTTVTQIMNDNPALPQGATILEPGMHLRIPSQAGSLTTPVNFILADALFINGPAQVDFDLRAFIQTQPGWLKDYSGFDGTTTRSGAEIVEMAVRDYRVSPRLLLAFLEYQSGAMSKPQASSEDLAYPMGYKNSRHKHLYNQVMLVSRLLNEGYYTWRAGEPLSGGDCAELDPRQNAASVALSHVFCQLLSEEDYRQAVVDGKFAEVYARLFGSTGEGIPSHLPANLRQPDLSLPFEPGKVWAFTGGPHTAWGESGQPWAALDFAPPSLVFGCQASNEWATAVAPGLVVRSENGLVSLDLDKDGDEKTGWVIYYYHIGTKERVAAGKMLDRGDYVGHPSCEGGRATGSHIHVSRSYNGEWILAYGALTFDMEGWTTRRGEAAYAGSMVRGREIVVANTNANDKTLIMSDARMASQITYRPPEIP